MVTVPGGRRGEADHDPHRGRLAGAVGTEEAGHRPGLAAEADVVDGGEGAVLPGESFDFDHGSTLPDRRRRPHRTRGWTTPMTKVGVPARPRAAAPPTGRRLALPRGPARPRGVPAAAAAVEPRLAAAAHARHQRAGRGCRSGSARRTSRTRGGSPTSRSAPRRTSWCSSAGAGRSPIALVTALAGAVSGIAAGPAMLAAVSVATRRRWREIALVGSVELRRRPVLQHAHRRPSDDPAWLLLIANAIADRARCSAGACTSAPGAS